MPALITDQHRVRRNTLNGAVMSGANFKAEQVAGQQKIHDLAAAI
jgi:hypothetical protein